MYTKGLLEGVLTYPYSHLGDGTGASDGMRIEVPAVEAGDGFTNNFLFAAPSTMTLEISPNPGTARHNWSPQNTQWPATAPDGMRRSMRG